MLVSQKKSARQLTCRYARTGENRRQLLQQEAVAVFRLPAGGKGLLIKCPRPSPGRNSLARLATSLRNHPTLGKLLLRVSVLPARAP